MPVVPSHCARYPLDKKPNSPFLSFRYVMQHDTRTIKRKPSYFFSVTLISCTFVSKPTRNRFPLHSTVTPPQKAQNQIDLGITYQPSAFYTHSFYRHASSERRNRSRSPIGRFVQPPTPPSRTAAPPTHPAPSPTAPTWTTSAPTPPTRSPSTGTPPSCSSSRRRSEAPLSPGGDRGFGQYRTPTFVRSG